MHSTGKKIWLRRISNGPDTDKAKEYIINSSYDEKYGARPIKRYVQRNIETLIATAIINDQIKYGSTITIDLINNQLTLKTID